MNAEDLERLRAFWQEMAADYRPHIIHSADASRVVAALAALRSVMAEHAKCAGRYVAGVAERNDVACDLEDRLAAVMAERDAWRTQRDAFKLSRDTAREAEDQAVRERDEARAERDALAEWKTEVCAEWERFLRAPSDAESDKGSKALDQLMEAT